MAKINEDMLLKIHFTCLRNASSSRDNKVIHDLSYTITACSPFNMKKLRWNWKETGRSRGNISRVLKMGGGGGGRDELHSCMKKVVFKTRKRQILALLL